MSWDDPTPPSVTVTVQDKPVLYLPDGGQVTTKKPVGFANHPAVPPLNRRKP